MGIFVLGPIAMPFFTTIELGKLNWQMNQKYIKNSIKIRFFIISAVYIIFWVTACTTIFSSDICSILLLFFFIAIFLPTSVLKLIEY